MKSKIYEFDPTIYPLNVHVTKDFDEVLKELSIYRQEHDLDPMTFSCEGSCCEFLDLIDD